MRSRTSVSESRLGEWQTFQKMGAAGAPALRAHHGWARSEENFALSTAFSNRKMASTRRHTACRRTAELASRTCCLPFYTYTFRMEAQTQRRAQTKCKSICTKVGRQCQNRGTENGV